MTALTLTVLDDVDAMHAPALHTMSYLQDSNGWAVPVATAHDVADYSRRAQTNDRNGSYGTVAVGADERLSWSIGDDEPMSWAPIGMTARGTVYALDGLCWHRLSDLLSAAAPTGRCCAGQDDPAAHTYRGVPAPCCDSCTCEDA